MQKLRNILAPDEETLYRRDFLRADGQRLLFGCTLGVLFSIVFAAFDFNWLGNSPPFYLLLAARGGFVAFTLVTAWVVRHSDQAQLHDRIGLSWGFLVVLLNIAVVFSRPATFTHNVVPELAVVMLLYLILPDRLPWRFLPPLALSVSSLVLLFTVKEPPGITALQSIVSAFVAANFLGIVAGIYALSYRRRTWKNERELRALAQQRQHMLAMKNRMVATLSHEFRSPLNVIASSSTLLGQYHRQLDDDQRGQVIGRLREAVSRLTEMLDDALFVSRRDAGQMTSHPVAIEVAPWLAALVDELRGSHIDGRDFSAAICDDIGERLIDPVLTKRIIVNLVANACKFTPPPGKVRFAARCEGSRLTLEVADNGCGIPLDDQPFVFEPFHRAGNATSVQGTGLGLAIVKEAVELLDGDIELASAPGVGTTVRVGLPLKQVAHV